jgi:hypothetical protein
MSGSVFLFYLALALNDAGEANWTATGMVSALGVMVLFWRRVWRAGSAWRWFPLVAVGLAVVQTVLLHETALLHLPTKKDPLNRVRGWQSLGSQVDALRQEHPTSIIVAADREDASLIHFYTTGRPTTYQPRQETIQNQFSFWPQYEVGPETSLLFFIKRGDPLPPEIQKDFSQIELIKQFITTYEGKDLKPYDVYFCRP